MARRNRVDELEEEVAQLKATVQGLTEELVEAHERIRQIERALAGDEEAVRETAREAASEVAADVAGSFAGADPEEVARAAAEAEETVEADKAQGAEGPDEAEGELDDIIVA